ncbi:MAG: copper resistance CopC family protein [Micrococcaceae bacterium]
MAAHDTLLSASPEADDVLEQSPETITLEFSGTGLITGETIPNTIVLRDANGANWEGETVVEGSTMSTELPEPLPNGEFDVAYRVVYSDGHTEEHSYRFEVADPDVTDEIVSETSEHMEDRSADTTEDASSSTLGWVLGIGVTAAVCAGLILLVMRRQVSASGD